MATIEEKWRYFLSLFGGDEAAAKRYVAANSAVQKTLEAQGVTFKEQALSPRAKALGHSLALSAQRLIDARVGTERARSKEHEGTEWDMFIHSIGGRTGNEPRVTVKEMPATEVWSQALGAFGYNDGTRYSALIARKKPTNLWGE